MEHVLSPKITTINVLDKGHVRYIDHLGSDLRIVETARISYLAPSKGEEKDRQLLSYLFINRHTSPFESCNITFNIKLPIFVMRQLVRHRTFRLCEQSGRYTEFEETDFYTPNIWRRQAANNKQSSYGEISHAVNRQFMERYEEFMDDAFQLYHDMLQEGTAREMARLVLPVSVYTEIYVNADLHNLMNFFNLRLDDHAQWEIQEYARAMAKITEELFPETMHLFKQFQLQQTHRRDGVLNFDTTRTT